MSGNIEDFAETKSKSLYHRVKTFLPRIRWVKFCESTPKSRREFFAAVFCLNLWFHSQFWCFVLAYQLLVNAGLYWRIFLVTYIFYILLDPTGDYGLQGQGNMWFRSWRVWTLFAEYFPIKIIKTVELPPTKNYIFAVQPHGVMALSFFAHFGTNGTGFHEAFPGVRVNICTLSMNFWHPFYRELVKAWGVVKITKKTMQYILNQKPGELLNNSGQNFKSSSIAIVVGGSQECTYSQRGKYILHIKDRKGFIKIAIETGASIVPVFSFGKTDMYNVFYGPPGSFWGKFQEIYKKVFTYSPILFSGRGMFQYNFGLLPFRVPVNSVFGAPIDVVKNENPTQEEIDDWHRKYMEAVEDIFETYKWKYLKDPDKTKLVMK